jgi:flagellar assembly protein FliH
MTHTETIALREPLHGVCLVRADPAEDEPARLRVAELAGYERGRRESETALREQLLRQRNEMLQVHQGVLESLRQAVPGLIRQTEEDLVALALEAARKLVAGLPITAEMVEAAVRDALAQVEETTDLHIELHPEDLAQLQRLNSPLLTPGSGSGKLCFHASQEVTRGGCLVQTRFGVLDACRETKLARLKKSLGFAQSAPGAVAPESQDRSPS